MSHFTRVKTVIRDQVMLEESLRQLHYNYRVGEHLKIRGYSGNEEHAQVVVNTGCRYDIGFQRQTDETFNVCADWWGVQGNSAIRQDRFMQEINQTYAHRTVKRQVREEGFIIEEEKVLANGEIEIVVAELI